MSAPLSPEREAEIRAFEEDEHRNVLTMGRGLDDVLAELDRVRAELATARADALTDFAARLTRKAEAMGAEWFRADQVCEALHRVAVNPTLAEKPAEQLATGGAA
ncbi:hypothetical protein [Streptomyces sp. NPDC002540]